MVRGLPIPNATMDALKLGPLCSTCIHHGLPKTISSTMTNSMHPCAVWKGHQQRPQRTPTRRPARMIVGWRASAWGAHRVPQALQGSSQAVDAGVTTGGSQLELGHRKQVEETTVPTMGSPAAVYGVSSRMYKRKLAPWEPTPWSQCTGHSWLSREWSSETHNTRIRQTGSPFSPSKFRIEQKGKGLLVDRLRREHRIRVCAATTCAEHFVRRIQGAACWSTLADIIRVLGDNEGQQFWSCSGPSYGKRTPQLVRNRPNLCGHRRLAMQPAPVQVPMPV